MEEDQKSSRRRAADGRRLEHLPQICCRRKKNGRFTADFPSDRNTNTPFCSDPGEWDKTSQELMAQWTEKGPQKCHSLDTDFSLTKQEYTNQNRYLTKSMFEYGKPNKRIGKREWLIYSPSQKKVNCFYFRLFSDIKKWGMFCEGSNDWKNTAYITSRAVSEQHTLSVSSYHA
ncbi:unnamed protein product [Caretta caretta]